MESLVSLLYLGKKPYLESKQIRNIRIFSSL